MKNIIFRNRMALSSWGLIIAGFAVAGLLVLFLSKPVDQVAVLTSLGGLALLTLGAMFVFGQAFARHQVAELALVNGVLEAELFALVGRGRTVSAPLAETSNWRWASRTGRGVKFATLAFSFDGVEYRMPFNGAQVLDIPALKVIAPGVFQTQ